MIGLLNIGSLLLGLIAWILPMINLMRNPKHNHNNWIVLSMISMSACTTSLLFQMFNSYNRAKIEDWSALMDIMGARVSVATILLVGTIILNGITVVLYRRRIAK